MTLFIRLTDVRADRKDAELRKLIHNGGAQVFSVDVDQFRKVPCSPFAYWAPTAILQLFERFPQVEIPGRHAAAGASTKDNTRFLRNFWEVPISSCLDVDRAVSARSAWVPLAKGGANKRFYADVYLVVQWGGDGKELKCAAGAWREAKGWGDHWKAELHNSEYYGRPGITWPVRSQIGFSARALGTGAIFGHKGPTIFVQNDNTNELDGTLAIVNSSVFSYLVSLQMAFGAYEVGVIQRTPIPSSVDGRLAALTEALWVQEYNLDAARETSHAFILPRQLLDRLQPGSSEAPEEVRRIYTEIDDIVFDAYGLTLEERAVIEAWVNRRDAGEVSSIPERAESAEDSDDGELPHDGSAFVSWAVGTTFGRFDLRLATGERLVPPVRRPFDRMPPKSAAMLPDGDAPFMPTSGVFVDDPGHSDDLAARVTAVYERVGEAAPAADKLRRTLARDFFPAHIRMYSKSRRKAPIYWQLATPSASYSVWLYIHAFGKDTLFRVQNDYVAPKLAHQRRELEGLLAEAGPSPTTPQSRAIEAQSNFVEELSALLDEVKRVAPLWYPDLDDGVILNFAPLWRLVPQNRAWQKELRAAWASLVDGDYDWAHLSMRLWPERVVPKCAKDRSLAIAHDLEDVFWFEDAAGKWQPRPTPTRSLDDLIAERTSPAVKAALQSLLDAPDPVAASGRGRRKKS